MLCKQERAEEEEAQRLEELRQEKMLRRMNRQGSCV